MIIWNCIDIKVSKMIDDWLIDSCCIYLQILVIFYDMLAIK